MPAAFSCEIRPIKIPSTAIDEGESYASMRKEKKEKPLGGRKKMLKCDNVKNHETNGAGREERK